MKLKWIRLIAAALAATLGLSTLVSCAGTYRRVDRRDDRRDFREDRRDDRQDFRGDRRDDRQDRRDDRW